MSEHEEFSEIPRRLCGGEVHFELIFNFIYITLLVNLLVILICGCAGERSNDGETSLNIDLNRYTLSSVKLPGAYAENIIYNGWVYYAPFSKWKTDTPYISAADADNDYDDAKILVRQNIKTAETQTLNISQGTSGLVYCVGIDKDEQGNIYTIDIKGTIFKVIVNEDAFSESEIKILKLPDKGGYYVNILYYKNYLYITPMAHGFLCRMPVNNYSLSAIEFIDLTAIDPEATGYNGLSADKKGFIWGAPSWNGKRRTGKVLRINPDNFTLSGTSIIDLELVNPLAQGYHGVCCNGDKVVFVPHWNDAIGLHANIAIIDINQPYDSAKILDIGKYNDQIGGMINCVNVKDSVLLFPYQKYTAEGSEGYGIITILNPKTLDVSYLSLLDIFPETKITPYDGSFDGKCVFLSPYKSYIEGVEYLDSRAPKICFEDSN